jgi:DNA ligase (NAD+)
MNIEGFSEKTAELLNSVFSVEKFSDLYKLDKEKVGKLEGYKEAKTSNLFDAIEKSKNVSLSNFIFALGIDNVGKKTAKDFAKAFGDMDNLINATKEQLIEINDVGEVVAECVFDYFNDQENVREIKELFSLGIKVNSSENVSEDGVFKGEKVVLTGTLIDFKRDVAGKIIESLGGEIVGSVSKNTTLVIAGENAGSKLDKAKSLGIKIIDEDMFKSLIKT